MEGCILHSDSADKHGYGRRYYMGKMQLSHRVAHCEYHKVSLAAILNQHVRHSCDNPRCINPSHLAVGSQQDNMDDRNSRGRTAKGEAHGKSVLSAEDIMYIRATYQPFSRLYGGVALAKLFGVSSQQIANIAAGRRWTHI